MSELLSDEELQGIRERCDKATSGEWDVVDETEVMAMRRDSDAIDPIVVVDTRFFHGRATEQQMADSQFIAHARSDIPALLVHIAAQQAEIERLRGREPFMKASAKLLRRIWDIISPDTCIAEDDELIKEVERLQRIETAAERVRTTTWGTVTQSLYDALFALAVALAPASDAEVPRVTERVKTTCQTCGCCSQYWEDCDVCGGEGYCEMYEEDPLWYDEDDVAPCAVCQGKGGWWVCPRHCDE